MKLRKSQKPILAFNIAFLSCFTLLFLSRENYEFVLYIAVITFFLILILLTNDKVNYPDDILWGLSLWGFLHMTGGGIKVGGKIVYELILVDINKSYGIFRYDQFVHIVGFAVATLLMYHLIKPLLKDNIEKWTALSIVIIMAGLGVGALNEIIEFAATVLVPETGVGGYINTSLDLVADLIGAIIAMAIIIRKEKTKHNA